MKSIKFLIVAVASITLLAGTVQGGYPELPLNLGAAGNYVVLTKSGISTVPLSTIVGNMGVSPIAATAITGFGLTLDGSGTFSTSLQVYGKIYAADYASPTPANLTTAIGDMETAYTAAANRTAPDAIELADGDISGLTLAPGLYKWSTGVLINSNVTLAGGANDIWIFQITGDLTMASAKSVVLSGGARATNIFWQVAGGAGATIGTLAHFEGNLLTATKIVLQTGASVNGRLLAQTAVTMDQNAVNVAVVKLSSTNVNVREAGEGRFFVKLGSAPVADVTVNVAHDSGDASLVVGAGGTLTFTVTNWNTAQGVVLTQADDANTNNETATFKVSATGVTDQYVNATALDDDGIGENMALASSGSVITGTTGGSSYGAAYLIDGLHAGATSGYTVWSNMVPPGSMTLDLLATATVSRIRMLNYPVSEKPQQYKVEYQNAGGGWLTLVDASTGEHRGWEDWSIANVPARYLRFTGLNNTGYKFVRMAEWEVWGTRSLTTVPQLEFSSTNVNVREGGEGRFYVRLDKPPATNVVVNVVRNAGDSGLTVLSGATMTFSPANYGNWRRVTLQAAADGNGVNETATFKVSTPWSSADVAATALDGEIGENLARTGGSTITGNAGSYGRPKMIDGIHTDAANYGYTVSTNVPAATITLDLKANANIARVRLLNFDWIKQDSRYRIEGSTNLVDWTDLAPDAHATARQGWDEWVVTGSSVRYLRFTGISNSICDFVRIAEWEVYGTRPGGKRSLKVAGTFAKESEPVSVVTSDGLEDPMGWDAVDGDTNTAWVGQKPGGGYLLVEYAPALQLKTLGLDLAEGSLTNVEYLYSLDAKAWQPLPEDMESNPVSLNFLWLLFPDDGTLAVPNVLEIHPNP